MPLFSFVLLVMGYILAIQLSIWLQLIVVILVAILYNKMDNREIKGVINIFFLFFPFILGIFIADIVFYFNWYDGSFVIKNPFIPFGK